MRRGLRVLKTSEKDHALHLLRCRMLCATAEEGLPDFYGLCSYGWFPVPIGKPGHH